jgi:hypothetical protein
VSKVWFVTDAGSGTAEAALRPVERPVAAPFDGRCQD